MGVGGGRRHTSFSAHTGKITRARRSVPVRHEAEGAREGPARQARRGLHDACGAQLAPQVRRHDRAPAGPLLDRAWLREELGAEGVGAAEGPQGAEQLVLAQPGQDGPEAAEVEGGRRRRLDGVVLRRRGPRGPAPGGRCGLGRGRGGVVGRFVAGVVGGRGAVLGGPQHAQKSAVAAVSAAAHADGGSLSA